MAPSIGGDGGGGGESLCLGLGLGLRMVVIVGVMVVLGVAGGSEEAEGAGERVLEEASPSPRRRTGGGGGGGGAAQAKRRGQALRHIAGVRHGDADRHREAGLLISGILLEIVGHFHTVSRDGGGGGEGRGVSGGSRVLPSRRRPLQGFVAVAARRSRMRRWEG
jgi:hypothetical protein